LDWTLVLLNALGDGVMSNEDDFWIDECFRVYKTQYGLWHSAAKDGEELVTAMTKEKCISSTRFYLKGRQEGWGEETTRVMNDGKVGGKL